MKLLEELEGYLTSQFNTLKMLFSLIKLEAKLAGLAIPSLIITLCMLFIILISFWATFTSLLGYFIYNQFHSMWWAISGPLLLNFIMLGILITYFIHHLKAMSFEKTRHYLNAQGNDHERLKKATSSTDQ